MEQNKKNILIAGVLIVGAGALFLLYNNSFLKNGASEEEKEFNESGRAKAILDETDLWKFYEDKDTGLLIKYPGDVNFQGSQEGGPYTLSVESQKVDSLEGTMGFNRETAEENLEYLNRGEYGKNVDWPLSESKKVVKIGSVNAQEFMVLSRFEICDVVFQRKLYFFYNNYQIVVTLAGPKQDIISNSPEYFETNKENCGDEKIWNFDKQKDFFESLENGAGSEAAITWFNLFDRIKGTIEFSEEQAFNLNLLQGKWVSLDDADSKIEFSGAKKLDYYQDEKMSEGSFLIQDNKYLVVSDGGNEFEYIITELSDENLTLIYTPRGNTLRYKKVGGE